MRHTISARWLASGVENGVVSWADGVIDYVGPFSGQRIDEHFGDAVILPGLINAHTHLDLTGAAGKTPPSPDFCGWLRAVIAHRKSRTADEIRQDVAAGVEQCLAAGTTLVGDITAAHYDYSQLNAVAFQELIGLSKERGAAAIKSWRAAGFTPAVSPHAPYSFRFDQLDALPCDAPLSIHLAETQDELKLLASHDGPFREFLEELGAWDPSGLAPSVDSILNKLACRTGPTLLVHGNYLRPDTAVPANATIVYCPRTHTAFGHARHPYREFISRGSRVVLGTDSLASNPDLSVLAEARFLAHRDDVASGILLSMITDWPAEALGLAAQCGSLARGRCADVCVVELPPKAAYPLQSLFHEHTPVIRAYIAGKCVARQNRHGGL